MAVNFLSSSNVRVVLTTMKRMIVQKIVSNIAEQQKACLIFDSTQDFSKKEANVLLLRYLEINSMGDLHSVERLLEVFTCGETSGKILKGEAGLATLIQKECKKQFIFGAMHTGLLEDLYSFMNGHRRNAVFQNSQSNCQHKMQLKRVQTTRWNSTESAVETVMKRYSEILASLSELAESSLSDGKTVTVALGLRKRMKNIRVIISMKILKLVYNIIGPVYKAVQCISIDMASATELIKDCIHQFDIIRRNADLTWKTICSESKSFATAHSISPDFDFERRRTKKKCLMNVAATNVQLD
ncbi:hypothetical protein HELRODRAFT_160142 [Helobdella robusta]|uniref:DUF4371 domain-containing protein n=1 Tax=Helobdella robusta TaxID=6412 RepID=T1EPV6_HELRO|nr:hypothetical protein HELRODRAFT_160142 [Helobdella robusta]ESO06029.1 hypothetical protein HELRODRAFT_160142 [Helobdella robusta]